MNRKAVGIALQASAWLLCVSPGSGLLPTSAAAAECGSAVRLHLSADQATQGSLLLAEVTTASGFTAVEGDWDGRKIEFWKAGTATGQSGAGSRSLVGIDLEKPPGDYKVTVEARKANGEKAICTATVTVKQGRFATERLQVGKQFVEPDPQQVQRAEDERTRLREIYRMVSPQPLWKGKFRRPLDSVSTGGNFGKRRVLNGKAGSPHGGVDFPAITGTPVHAAQAGKVVLADNLFFSGNTVVVDHGLGIYTFYCHFSAISVKVGEEVEAGTILGKVGATGRVTGPHLHWALSVDRERVNPLEIVRLLGK
ncbi:MAG TPA: M23 family metallopeptidase [Candidatus Saccharimonadales bacterium]|nr:M23 family metallopeptidase [Candidatus Saccharimonadales bacterium]